MKNINIDCNSLFNIKQDIKYLRFINEITKEEYEKYKIFFTENNYIKPDGLSNDGERKYIKAISDYTELEINTSAIPIIDMLFNNDKGYSEEFYYFEPNYSYNYDEEEETFSKIKETEEIIMEKFELHLNTIDDIKMNAEETGFIPVYVLYNKVISHMLKKLIEHKFFGAFLYYKEALINLFYENIKVYPGYRGLIVNVFEINNEYVIGYISSNIELSQFQFISYDILKFYKKSLFLLKNSSLKV